MMTIDNIKYLCSQTYPKEKLDKLLEIIEKQNPKDAILLWRILVPKKMFLFYLPKRFKFAWGGRWGSKTHSACKIALYLASQEKARFLFTREIQNTIAESLHAELKELIYNLGYDEYKVTENYIFNTKTKSEFIFKGLQQQDRKQTIKSLSNVKYCIVEEAQTISKASLDILVPTIRKANSELWFLYNKILADDPVESLRLSVDESEKIEINILAQDNLFNSKETLRDIARLKRQYEDGINDDYLHVVLGHPASLSDRVILTIRDIEQAINRNINDEGAIEIGVDVARFGKDRTVFFKRKGMKIIDWKVYKKKSTIEVCGLLVEFVGRSNTDVLIKIDDTGIGGSITDFMQENGYNVEPIIFGAKSSEPDKYNNLITEMWFYFQSILKDVCLPDLQELKSELSTREYKIDMKGRKQVESKEDYKKRYNKSPDLADALLLCYYENNSEYAHCFGGSV
jgi:phage terminase large subunit